MNPRLRAGLAAGAVALAGVALLVARLGGGAPEAGWSPATEAARHVGERGTVCGEVASTRYAPSVDGEPTFLNLERPYPDQVFTAVIWGDDRPRFDRPPEAQFRDRRICVTGKIGVHRGTPQIIVRRPDQIEMVREDR
ncbi:MAG: hypothetical protein ACOC92_01750 [bacterium]